LTTFQQLFIFVSVGLELYPGHVLETWLWSLENGSVMSGMHNPFALVWELMTATLTGLSLWLTKQIRLVHSQPVLRNGLAINLFLYVICCKNKILFVKTFIRTEFRSFKFN